MKRISKKVILILLFAILIPLFLQWVMGETTETTTITFSDNNLYTNIKNKEIDLVVSSDNNAKTLEFRTQDIPDINTLNLSNCEIYDISGIEKFTRINRIRFINK